jgi:hypothetical protein
VEVDATVLKVMPHSRMTAYFVQYVLRDEERIAELRGAPMRRAHEVGDKLFALGDVLYVAAAVVLLARSFG